MKSLDEISACWANYTIQTTLACWDIEFQSNYYQQLGEKNNIEILPLFQCLMPRMKPESRPKSSGEFSPRGIFHIPMRRLLEMSYCLAYFCRNQKFPDASHLSRSDIDAWAGEANRMQGEGNIAKIYRGTMGLSALEFDEIWISMCGKNKGGKIPIAPWPTYIAAQIWTHLYVTKSTFKGSRTTTGMVIPSPEIYTHWWHYHYEKIGIAAPNGKVTSWPDYLKSSEDTQD
jgi:hypothetical protein